MISVSSSASTMRYRWTMPEAGVSQLRSPPKTTSPTRSRCARYRSASVAAADANERRVDTVLDDRPAWQEERNLGVLDGRLGTQVELDLHRPALDRALDAHARPGAHRRLAGERKADGGHERERRGQHGELRTAERDRGEQAERREPCVGSELRRRRSRHST